VWWLQSAVQDAVKDAFAVDDMNFVYFWKRFVVVRCLMLLIAAMSAAANKCVHNKMTKGSACVIQTVICGQN